MTRVSVPGDFATVQFALDYASGLNLKRKNEFTIDLAEGEFVFDQANLTVKHNNGGPEQLTGSSSIVCDLLNGKGIKIKGAKQLSFAGASIYRMSTVSPGVHQLTMAFSSVAGAIVGRYMKIRATSGDGDHAGLRGCWKIISVRSETNRIVLELRDKRSILNEATITGGVFTQLNTTLRWTGLTPSGGDFGGFDLSAPFGEIDCVAIIGDGITDATNGILCRLGTVLNLGQNVGIAGWGRTGLFLIEGSFVEGVDLQVSNCTSTGINVTGTSYFSGTRAGASGCNLGMVVGAGSAASLSTGSACGNDNGLYCASGGQLVIGAAFVTGNNIGATVKENATLDNSAGSTFDQNVIDVVQDSGGVYIS